MPAYVYAGMHKAQPLAFFHFRVRLYHRGRFFRAYLLDLDENEARFALPSDQFLQSREGASIRGSVDSRYATEADFTGMLVSREGMSIRGQFFHTVLVRFDRAIELSERLLATRLSLSDAV